MALPFLLRFGEQRARVARPGATGGSDLRTALAQFLPAEAAAVPAVVLAAYPGNREALLLERELTSRGVPTVVPSVDGSHSGESLTWSIGAADRRHRGT